MSRSPSSDSRSLEAGSIVQISANPQPEDRDPMLELAPRSGNQFSTIQLRPKGKGKGPLRSVRKGTEGLTKKSRPSRKGTRCDASKSRDGRSGSVSPGRESRESSFSQEQADELARLKELLFSRAGEQGTQAISAVDRLSRVNPPHSSVTQEGGMRSSEVNPLLPRTDQAPGISMGGDAGVRNNVETSHSLSAIPGGVGVRPLTTFAPHSRGGLDPYGFPFGSHVPFGAQQVGSSAPGLFSSGGTASQVGGHLPPTWPYIPLYRGPDASNQWAPGFLMAGAQVPQTNRQYGSGPELYPYGGIPSGVTGVATSGGLLPQALPGPSQAPLRPLYSQGIAVEEPVSRSRSDRTVTNVTQSSSGSTDRESPRVPHPSKRTAGPDKPSFLIGDKWVFVHDLGSWLQADSPEAQGQFVWHPASRTWIGLAPSATQSSCGSDSVRSQSPDDRRTPVDASTDNGGLSRQHELGATMDPPFLPRHGEEEYYEDEVHASSSSGVDHEGSKLEPVPEFSALESATPTQWYESSQNPLLPPTP